MPQKQAQRTCAGLLLLPLSAEGDPDLLLLSGLEEMPGLRLSGLPESPGEASLRLGEDPGEVGALGDPDLSEAALSAAVGEAGAAPGVTVTPEQASEPHLY